MIVEGLHNKDLQYMVRPIISLDEYVSKIDATAIVAGFYCSDRDSANDLNKFIQRSPVNLLDSEVSLSPNIHGEYMVFVEFLNNNNTINEINKLCKHLSSLTQIDINKWQIRYKGKVNNISEININETKIYFNDNEFNRFNLLEAKQHNNIFKINIDNGVLIYENGLVKRIKNELRYPF